jgi:predicted KAP-like P-loop ATPase
MGLSERLAPLLLSSGAVQSNPRLIKRFLNTVFLRKALATPQGINVDIPLLAKWHLLERCEEVLANALADATSAQNDGRVGLLRHAEELAKNPDSTLGTPFGEKPFVREWLQLDPPLGDVDMRPLLHLSRDSTIRDFGSDDLSAEGKELCSVLETVRTESAALREKIHAAGEIQASLAMARAWERKRSTRTWAKSDDVFMLKAICSAFPLAGARAAALLAEAPVVELGPALAASLVSCEWSNDTLNRWIADPNTPEPVKRAINAGRSH